MARFTGEYQGVVPECMNPPESERTPDVDRKWNYDAYPNPCPRRSARSAGSWFARAEVQHRPGTGARHREHRIELRPAAVSPKSALGVMQLIPETAERFNVKDAFDPAQNIKGGLAYLRWLLAYFEGNVALAAAGYNAGEGAVDRYGGIPSLSGDPKLCAADPDAVQGRYPPFERRVVEPSQMLRSLRVAVR